MAAEKPDYPEVPAVTELDQCRMVWRLEELIMSNKKRPYQVVGIVGYVAGAAAIATFLHQHMPLLTGEAYTFDHGANLANGAIALISAVAILTSKALKELENKVKKMEIDRDVSS